MLEKLQRLASVSIQLLPVSGITNHFVLERGGYVALVERTTDNNFGRVGDSGLLTAEGFAALVWRPEGGFFVNKRCERPAEPAEVEEIRRFSRDLRAALDDSR